MVSHKKWGNSQEATKNLYLTLSRSRIAYGLNIYGDCTKITFNKLEKLQNAAIRIILGVPPTTANDVIHILADIPHLAGLKEMLLLKFASKKVSHHNYNLDVAK